MPAAALGPALPCSTAKLTALFRATTAEEGEIFTYTLAGSPLPAVAVVLAVAVLLALAPSAGLVLTVPVTA